MFGLYDYIYNKVENAELAIKDTVSRATCPDVDSYIEKNMTSNIKCTLCQVQKVCVLVNIAIFIWIVLLAALSYPFAYPAVGVKVTAGEAEPMP